MAKRRIKTTPNVAELVARVVTALAELNDAMISANNSGNVTVRRADSDDGEVHLEITVGP